MRSGGKGKGKRKGKRKRKRGLVNFDLIVLEILCCKINQLDLLRKQSCCYSSPYPPPTAWHTFETSKFSSLPCGYSIDQCTNALKLHSSTCFSSGLKLTN